MQELGPERRGESIWTRTVDSVNHLAVGVHEDSRPAHSPGRLWCPTTQGSIGEAYPGEGEVLVRCGTCTTPATH